LESLRPVLDQCLLMKGISGVPIAPFNGAPHALELSTWLTAQLPDADEAQSDPHRHLCGPDRGELLRRSHRIAFAGTRDDAADAQGEPGRPERGLLLALQLPLAHPGDACGDQSAQCAEPFVWKVGPGKAGQTDPLDRQMLDLVIGGAKDLRKQAAAGDQQKLDEYLDSVRSVERRIAAIEYRQKEAALEKAGVASSKRNASDSPPIEIKIPEGDKRSEYMQVMCDLTCSPSRRTPPASAPTSAPHRTAFRIPNSASATRITRPTHHNNEADKVRKVAAITAFNIDAVRLHGEKDGQPPRRRRNAARQLHHDVGFSGLGGRQQAHPREPALHHRRQGRRLRQHGAFHPTPKAIKATCSPPSRLRRRATRPPHRHRERSN
jgi:hypothetical protein